jgi:hypothetical protein
MVKSITLRIMQAMNKLGLNSSAMLILLLLIVIGMSVRSPYFLTTGNFEVIMSSFVLEAIRLSALRLSLFGWASTFQ